jgi:4-aminobutyrate aminotransferase-like enzyme
MADSSVVFLMELKPMSLKVAYGSGLRVIREDDVELLDAVSGTFNLPLGYNHPHVVEAVKSQVEKITHISSGLVGPHSQELLDRLLPLAPSGIDAGWVRDVVGSTAVECSIKSAQKYTGATDVISLFYSHHGQTQMTTALSGNSARRRGFVNPMSAYSLRVPAPYCYRCFYQAKQPNCALRCVSAIRDFIKHSSNGHVACIIVEPVLGNGGNIVPPKGYFDLLQKLCREENILLIADEVQTGIGRTGYMFASEALGITPDIIVLAKGLGGIGIPMAAVLMRSEVNVLQNSEHSFTSGSNMLGIAAALATLDVVADPTFLSEVRRKGEALGGMLEELKRNFSFIGDVRGLGMMWGIEIVRPDDTPDVERTRAILKVAMERHRLILRSSQYGEGNVVKIRPALVATDDDLTEIAARLTATLKEVA